MNRTILAALLLVGIAVMIYLSRGPRGVPVQVAEAERATIRSYVEERATTRLPDVYRITMPLQGRILPIDLREGQRVTVGQVVARMDTSDLDTDLVEAGNTVEQYARSLEQVELAIEQANQTVLASREQYKFQENEFGRVARLFSNNTTTESARNQAELAMIEARVELRKDELNRTMYAIGYNIVRLMHETEMAKKKKVERDRNRAQIVSPVDGVVLAKMVSNERVLTAGEVLLEIGDTDSIEVEADVLSQDAVLVRSGYEVDIEGVAVGTKPLQGRVQRIFPRGFTKVSSLGVEQQRVKVVVDFEDEALESLRRSGRFLGADYRLRVKIYTDQHEHVVCVPRTAVFRDARGRWQTFVVRDGRAFRTDVEIGLRNVFQVEIQSGLQAGDRVIVAPESSLEDGDAVEIRKIAA